MASDCDPGDMLGPGAGVDVVFGQCVVVQDGDDWEGNAAAMGKGIGLHLWRGK